MNFIKKLYWKYYKNFFGFPCRSEAKHYAHRHHFLKEYSEGSEIYEIAYDYDITRERVRQILLKYTRHNKLYEIVNNKIDKQ